MSALPAVSSPAVSSPPGTPAKGVVIVKLGGSLITDKETPLTARSEVISRLAAEIAEAQPKMSQPLVLSHGSGSFGHAAAAACGLGDGVYIAPGSAPTTEQLRGVATTQHQAASLHRQVVQALVKRGSIPYSWVPSSGLVAKAGAPQKGQLRPLLQALELGLMPVVYGDVLQDLAWGAAICSTEKLVNYLAARLRRASYRIHRVLWCGETDGIYDRQGQTIDTVNRHNLFSVRRQIGATRGTDVTGGMQLRLATCHTLARRGVESWLINGLTPGNLGRALVGEAVPGTRFAAKESA